MVLINSVNSIQIPALLAGPSLRIGAPPLPKPALARPMIIQTARLVLVLSAAILSLILFQSPVVINQAEAGPRRHVIMPAAVITV